MEKMANLNLSNLWQAKIIGNNATEKTQKCEKHFCVFEEIAFQQWQCPQCHREFEKTKKRQMAIAQKMANLNLPARFADATIENYVKKNANQVEICKSLQQYVDDFPDVGGIIMLGNIGTGKTHLAYGLCRAICSCGENGHNANLFSINRIIRKIRSSWNNLKLSEQTMIDEIVRLDFLVIDEVGAYYGNDSEKIIINEIINERYEAMKPTVLIGNLSVSEMQKTIGHRAYDRIVEGGLKLFFEWGSCRPTRKLDPS